MKNLNNKSKSEQIFILVIMFVAVIGVFCITGCGSGKSCEQPKCGNKKYEDISAIGCSIPGCGGCLSSGSGCNNACWAQSCKLIAGQSGNAEDEETGEKSALKIVACDTRYYDAGCLGCGKSERSCYNGCMEIEDESVSMRGFFYGSSGKEEKFIGCANGCGGCIGTDKIGRETIDEIEGMIGVN